MRLPEFRLIPEPADDAAARLVRPAYVDPGVGTLHKIGGAPEARGRWETPRCRHCQEEMSFYGQLDSLPTVEYVLADAGTVLVFVCFDCFTVEAVLATG